MTGRPRKRTLAHSTLAGVTYQYAATAANGVVQVGVIAILARLIAPVEFGQVGLATAYIGFWALFAAFGVNSALVQRPGLTERDLRAGFTLALGLGIGATVVVWITAPVAARVLGSGSLTPFIRALSATCVLGSPAIVAEAMLQREFEWQRLTQLNLLASLAQSAASCLLAALGLGAWALVGSNLLFTLLRTLLLLRAHPHPKRPLVRGTELGELVRFGRSFTAARLLNYGAQQGDNVVVGRVLGLAPLGFYSRAFKLMMQPVTNFGLVLTRVLFSIMARLQEEAERLRTAYLTGLAVISLVSGPLTALMVVLGPEIVLVLLGRRWMPAIVPFQILSAGLVLRLPNLMTYTIDGFTRSIAKRSLREGLYAAGVIAGALAGAPFGLKGVATGVLLGVVINYAAGTSISLQITHCPMREYVRAQVPGLYLGMAAAAAAVTARLGLRAAGAPPGLVLAGTTALVLGLLAAILYLFPGAVGVYGRGAIRMLAETLTNRHWGRQIGWVDRLSAILVRRWVSEPGGTSPAPSPVRATNAGPLARRIGLGLAGLGAVAGLALTLRPAPGLEALSAATPLLCLVCGDKGGVDVFLNLLLFTPVGAGLRLAGWRWRRVVGAVALLSLSVELLQLTVVTGRDASLSDLISNTTGAAVAAAIVSCWSRVLLPPPRRAAGLVAAWTMLWLGTLALTVWLQGPRGPRGPLVGAWPEQAAPDPAFRGRVVSAAVNGAPLPRGQDPPDRAAIRRSLDRGVATLEVTAVSGRPTADLVFLYSLRVGGTPLLGIAQFGRDAVLLVPARAQRLRIWAPTLQLRDGFPADSGIRVELRGAERDGRLRLSSTWGGQRREATMELRPTQGWAAVSPFKFVLARRTRLLTALWVGALMLPLGYWGAAFRRRSGALTTVAAGLAAGLGALPPLAGAPPAHWWEWAAGAGGAALGWALYRVAAYLQGRCASPSTSGSFSS